MIYLKATLFLFFFIISNKLNAQGKLNGMSLSGGIHHLIILKNADSNSNFEEDSNSKLGLQLNLTINISITPYLEFAIGIKYLQINYENEVKNLIFPIDLLNGTVTNVESKIQIHYIGVPLHLHYYFSPKTKNFSFTLGGTFYRSFNGKTERTISGGGTGDAALLKENKVRKYNFSISSGINYLIPIGKTELLIYPSIEYLLLQNNHNITFTKVNYLMPSLSVGFSF